MLLKAKTTVPHLVRTRERREDEFATVRCPRVHGQVIALGHNVNDLVQVGKVELGRDTLCVHVQGHRDEVDVARSLAVAKQATLDAICACHEAELRCSNASASVIVRVKRDDNVLPVLDVSAEVFDLNAGGQLSSQACKVIQIGPT